jgi:hypothetical protein
MELLRNVPSPISQTALDTNQSSASLLSTLPLETLSVGQRASSAIVFVDAGVSNYQGLTAGLQAGAEVYVLDPMQDAVTQITQTLLGKSNISSVEIISHGEAGGLKLGAGMLSFSNMRSYADQFQSWGTALTADADILLYGCDVAADPAGQAFVAFMGQMTGADVAASTDLTGQGGNWVLEYTTGSIEAQSSLATAATASYQGSLNNAITFTGAAVSFTENATNPTVLFAGASVAGSVPSGRTLTITPTGGETTDRLTVTTGGTVTVSGSNINVGGTTLATFTGGDGTNPLVITFNAAPASAAQSILRQVTFASTSENPSTTARSISAVFAGGTAVTQTVNVTAVNDVPTISNITKSGTEDTTLSFAATDFTSVYSDVETSLSSITVTAGPTRGTLQLGGATVTAGQVITAANLANLTYAPNANANGNDQFSWTASDGTASSTAGRVTLSLTAVNDAPTTINVSTAGLEEAPITLSAATFTSGFADVDGDTLSSILITSLPANGTLEYEGAAVMNGDRIALADISKLVYTGGSNFVGMDTFTWSASDGPLDSNVSTFSITLANVNDAPTLTADVSKPVNEDSTLTFAAADFSAVFSDVDTSDTLRSIKIAALPGDGSLRFNNVAVTAGQVILATQLGGLTYRPAADFNGNDGFTWSALDGGGLESNVVTMSLNVAAVNDAPTVSSFTLSGTEDSTLGFTLNDFADKFTDVDGDSLVGIAIVSVPQGTLTFTRAGATTTVTNGMAIAASEIASLTYTPVANATGVDGFTWTAGDSSLAVSNPGTVTINLAAVNDAPTISSFSRTLNEDTATTFGSLFTSNFTDVDGNALASITITSIPDDGDLSLGTTAVTANQVITAAQLATLTYRPDGNYNGTDSFTWSASDGTTDAMAGATVSLTITAVNDAPMVTTVAVTTDEDVAYTFTDTDFLSQYVDAEGSTMQSITVADLPSGGVLSLGTAAVTAGQVIATANLGSLTYAPNKDYSGNDSFSWLASDGTLTSITAGQVALTVTNLPDPPIISNLGKAGAEDVPFTFSAGDFSSVFTDLDGNDSLQSIRITALPTHGQLFLVDAQGIRTSVAFFTPISAADLNRLIYVPDLDYFGTDSFGWDASDGSPTGESNEALVELTIAERNEAPTIADISRTGLEDQVLTFQASEFSSVFTDTDGGVFSSIQITTLPTNGVLMLNGTLVTANQLLLAAEIPNLTYQGNANYFGADSFDWTATDSQGQNLDDTAVPATVSLTLTPVNDAPSFTLGTTLIDAMVGDATQTVTSFVGGFNPGPVNEASQTLTGYTVRSVSNPALFTIQPTLIPGGGLRYQAASGGAGGLSTVVIEGRDNGGTLNGGVNTTSQTLTIAVAPRPTVTLLSPSSDSIAEGRSGANSTFTFEVSLSAASSQAIRVTYATGGGTATAGDDYTGITDGVLTFAAGQTLQTITVTARGDNAIEMNETFGLSLTGVTGGTLSSSAAATATIINDDFSQVPSFTPAPSGGAVGGGDVDLVWRNAVSGDVYIWDMNGTNAVTPTYLKSVADAAWEIQTIADFTGDGKADVLWRNDQTGELLVWELNGTTFVQDVLLKTAASENIVAIDTSWEIEAVADFNGDGRQDLFWRNNISGRNYLWEMNGSTRTADTELFTQSNLSWEVEGTSDFNGDGNVDLFWRNYATGELYYWIMDGATIVDAKAIDYKVNDPAWQIEAFGDFDNDGSVDIFWRNYRSGINYIWTLDGDQGVTDAVELPRVVDLTWRPEVVGDFTGDGFLDILWRNYQVGSETTLLWEMNGTQRQAETEILPRLADINWEVSPIKL